MLLALLAARPALGAPTTAELNEVSAALVRGYQASATEAEAWEASLATTPEQPAVREQLISFYGQKRYSEESAKPLYAKHVLWVIAHHPGSPYAGLLANLGLWPPTDSSADYESAKALWLAHVAAHQADVDILSNAALFLQFNDKPVSEKLFKQAIATEPKRAELHAQLGRFYLLQARTKDAGAKYAAASSALQELERALALTPDEDRKLLLMDRLVQSSFMIQRFDKTTDYAIRWMKNVPVGRWDYANAQHYAHTALGLIALQNKDVKGARDHLAMSADHAGSPQLNSFGPCMDLAAALRDRGQQDAVLDYLEACGKFWKMGGAKLAEWTKAVEAGTPPDFSGHLSF